MGPSGCHGDHQGHLCVLASEKKIEMIRRLVTCPRFICFNCGRAASSRRNLCNPMALQKGRTAKRQGEVSGERSA